MLSRAVKKDLTEVCCYLQQERKMEADHGGIGASHGGATDAERYVSFFATGGNVRHTRLSDMYVRDTSSIILYALGIEQPASWTGRVPGGLFPECMENLPRPKGDSLPETEGDTPLLGEKGNFAVLLRTWSLSRICPLKRERRFRPGWNHMGNFIGWLVWQAAGCDLRMDI